MTAPLRLRQRPPSRRLLQRQKLGEELAHRVPTSTPYLFADVLHHLKKLVLWGNQHAWEGSLPKLCNTLAGFRPGELSALLVTIAGGAEQQVSVRVISLVWERCEYLFAYMSMPGLAKSIWALGKVESWNLVGRRLELATQSATVGVATTTLSSASSAAISSTASGRDVAGGMLLEAGEKWTKAVGGTGRGEGGAVGTTGMGGETQIIPAPACSSSTELSEGRLSAPAFHLRGADVRLDLARQVVASFDERVATNPHFYALTK